MTQLRKGDTVLFKAVVTDVAPYDEGQQICAKLLPKGESLGWCVPKEYEFVADERRVRVGDKVKWSQKPHDTWEVMFINDGWAMLNTPGFARPQVARLSELERK